MFCKNCGKPIPEGVAFCAECGARIDVQPEQTQPVNKTREFIEQKQAANAQANAANQATAPVQTTPPVMNSQNQKQGYASAAPVVPVKKEKDSKTALIIVLAVIAVIVVAIAIILIVSKNNKPKSTDISTGTQISEYTEDTTAEPSTEATTEATTETTTEATTKKQYGEDIGKPSQDDFKWYGGMNEQIIPPGAAAIEKSEALTGKWKAYFEYPTTSVKELNIVDIELIQDGVVKVTVEPYKVYVDGKWRDSDGKSCDYNGSVGDGTIGATSKYGTISFYEFHEKDGKQYAFGAYVNQSGESAFIALVR